MDELLKDMETYLAAHKVVYEQIKANGFPGDSITYTLYYHDVELLVKYINYYEERIAYLERSNNRREVEIMNLRQELVEG